MNRQRLNFYYILIIIFIILFFQVEASAEIFVGARAWQADWQPGILRAAEKHAQTQTLFNFLQGNKFYTFNRMASRSITGTYVGPLITYITEDQKWSFSLLALQGKAGRGGISQYTLTDITTNTGTGLYMNMDQTMQSRPVRNDVDFTVGRAVTEHLKIFAGYKFQNYIYNLDLSINGTVDDKGSGADIHFNLVGKGGSALYHRYSGGAGGLAYAFPVSDSGSITFSVGYFGGSGFSVEDSVFSMTSGLSSSPAFFHYSSSHARSHLKVAAGTYESIYTSRVNDSFFLQFGLRGQVSTMRIKKSGDNYNFMIIGGNTNFNTVFFPGEKLRDTFQGLTVSVLYRL